MSARVARRRVPDCAPVMPCSAWRAITSPPGSISRWPWRVTGRETSSLWTSSGTGGRAAARCVLKRSARSSRRWHDREATRDAMISVVVAAASSSARAGLAAILARDPGLQVIAVVSRGSTVRIGLDAGPPDVLLLEITGDPATALATELSAMLADQDHKSAIVVLAEAVSGSAAAGALRAGARAVLRWDASPDEILAAVHAAAAGLVTLPGDVAAELAGRSGADLDGRRHDGPATASATPLTPRERDVLAMMAEGVGNKSIARRLGISEHAVKTQVAARFAMV